MADEKDKEVKGDTAKTDAARSDEANAGQKLDKILECLDSVNGRLDKQDARMDAMGSRMDSMDTSRKDAEEKEKEEKEKADKARKDAEEKEKEGKTESGAKEVAADKKKADEEKEEKEKADKARKDAAEEKERMDAAARADANTLVDEVIKRIGPVKDLTDAEYDEMTTIQARADAVYATHGEHAPRYMRGETPLAYRRRLLAGMQKHSRQWGEASLAALSADPKAFSVAEQQIYADAVSAAQNPVDLEEGQLREVIVKDETGRPIKEFKGACRSWMGQFSGNRRQVVDWNKGERA